MRADRKELLIKWGINAFVVTAIVCVPGGLLLQYLYPDSSWWLLSAAAFILFYAG